MNILYISHLSTNIAAGLNWSVPASVNAQSKIDNVLWVNATEVTMEHWKKVPVFHNASEFGGLSMDKFPKPFNSPDVVVFEGFYYMDDVRMAKKLRKLGIPYIIVVRGSLTKQAMHNHAWLKKSLAHFLYFDSFVSHALAIQYLTEGECKDSIGRFKTPYFIVPNGFDTPEQQKISYFKNGVKAVFIGRLDMYHKGLDILLEVIENTKENLQKAGFTLDIYGPRRYDFYKIQEEISSRALSNIVSIHDEIIGDTKREILLGADMFIMTSRLEGHPMGLIEALAYGLPCLVTRGSNMLEEIKNADAGWTCEGSKQEVQTALLKAIEEKELYYIKGKNARSLSIKYNWDKLAQEFHYKIEKCLLLRNNGK